MVNQLLSADNLFFSFFFLLCHIFSDCVIYLFLRCVWRFVSECLCVAVVFVEPFIAALPFRNGFLSLIKAPRFILKHKGSLAVGWSERWLADLRLYRLFDVIQKWLLGAKSPFFRRLDYVWLERKLVLFSVCFVCFYCVTAEAMKVPVVWIMRGFTGLLTISWTICKNLTAFNAIELNAVHCLSMHWQNNTCCALVALDAQFRQQNNKLWPQEKRFARGA